MSARPSTRPARPADRARSGRAAARRAGALAAGLTATALVLAGCGGGSSGGSSSDKTVTVQVQATAEKQFAGFIKVFEKQHPGVTVKTTSVSQTAKNGSNLTVLTSSNAPDVAILPTNAQAYSRMLQAHQLVSLADVWKKDDLAKGFGAGVAATLKSNGTPYLVAYDRVFYNIVYYNTALFTKLGIAAPTDHRVSSMADFVAITKKLKAAGYQGLAFGPGDGYQSSWQLDSFLQQTATPAQYANYLTSWQSSTKATAKYTDPAFTNALAAIQAMAAAGVYQDGYLGQKVAQSESLFVQQKAGMLLDGNYSPSVLKSDGMGFDLGWMMLPPAVAGKKVKMSLYTGDTLAIPVKAKHQALAKEFLESVMSQAGQESQIARGQLPAVASVPTSAYSALPQVTQDQVADANSNGSQTGWTSGVPGGFGQQAVDPQVQAMFNGQTTPAAIGAKVQASLATTRSGQ